MKTDAVVPRRGPGRLLPPGVASAALGALLVAGTGAHRAAQGAVHEYAATAPAPADTPRARLRAIDRPRYEDSLREPTMVRAMNGVLNATVRVEMARLPVPRGPGVTPPCTCGPFGSRPPPTPRSAPTTPGLPPRFPAPPFACGAAIWCASNW